MILFIVGKHYTFVSLKCKTPFKEVSIRYYWSLSCSMHC